MSGRISERANEKELSLEIWEDIDIYLWPIY